MKTLFTSSLSTHMFQPFRVIIKRKLDERIRFYTETTPISQFLKDDVFIVGYPKSGNSWCQNLITGIVYGLSPAQAPDSVVQDLVPDVHYKRYYRRYKTPMFFKSHFLPRPDYRRVVYLLRDGRDVMVSYFRFLEILRAKNNQTVNFLDMVSNGDGLFQGCKWHEHVEQWLANPYNAEVLIVKYENLVNEPFLELSKLCNFINIEINEENLNRVIDEASFQKMRNKESQFGLNNTAWPKNEFFTRRGKIGSYKDEMPLEVLETFLTSATDTLKKTGYTL